MVGTRGGRESIGGSTSKGQRSKDHHHVIAGGIKKVTAERETRIKKEDGKMKRVEEG